VVWLWTPIDCLIPDGWTICVLAAYLDGSGDTHHGRAAQKYVSLASVAAYEPLWTQEFRPLWGELVRDNGGEPIHAAEMFSSQRADQIALLQRAVTIVGGLRRGAFHAFGCVVDLNDYERALPDCPELVSPRLADPLEPKPAESVCVDWCVGHLFDRLSFEYDNPDSADIGLVFDRDEDFLHWIYRVYIAKSPRRPWWAKRGRRRDDWTTPRVRTIVPGDKQSYPEIQAADIIAWVCNRHHTHSDVPDWYATITDGRSADFKFYNYKRLMVAYSNTETINRRFSDGA
jgi:Protein of unknown function (DUF3800)